RLTTATTGGSNVVNVINEPRTASSRTLTVSPGSPSSSSSAATRDRSPVHQSWSASPDRSVTITFSTAQNLVESPPVRWRAALLPESDATWGTMAPCARVAGDRAAAAGFAISGCGGPQHDRDAGHRRPGLVSGVAHRGDVGGRRRRGRRRNSIAGQPLRPGVGGLDGRGGQRARRARRRVDRRPSRVVRRRGRGVVLRRRDVLGGGRRRRPDRRRGGAVGRGRPAGGAGADRGGRGRGAGGRGGRRAGRAAGDPAAPAGAGPAGGSRRGTGLAGRRRAAAGEWLGRPR